MIALALVAFAPCPALAEPGAQGETVQQSLCRLIESAARAERLPVPFLTRLIWQESSFRTDAISRAGAQGVAQFMPGTARERGLSNPFDPEQAIPAAASFVADLQRRFGNLGLAAAAYNGGPNRVASWLSGQGGLPLETRDYVARITKRPVEDWARASPPSPSGLPEIQEDCLQVTADLKRSGGRGSVLAEGASAPWGVQLAGNFSKALALASYERNRSRLGSILADIQPMVLGSRLRSRGRLAFYRVRVPAPTRAEANGICARIRSARGACVVLRS